MPLSTRTIKMALHAWFFPEGDAISLPVTGTAAAETKPDPEDPGWVTLGPITNTDLQETAGEELESWSPVLGQLRRTDIKYTKPKVDLDFTVGEISALAFQLMFRTAALAGTANEGINPLEGMNSKGWLLVQAYDEDDEMVWNLQLWCCLKVSGSTTIDPGKTFEVKFSAKGLHSSLNVGTVA